MRRTMTNCFIMKMAIGLLLVFSCSSVLSQTISQYRFNFRGFSVIINDDAADENGNHLLAGEIRAVETEERNRDPHINEIFGLKGYCNDDRMGILITTDRNYKTLQIARSYRARKVLYDRKQKQFTIGANFLGYLHAGDYSFSAWQPVIIQVGLELKGKAYFLQKPYSCILDNMVIENDEIIIFTRSDHNQANELIFNEKTEVIRVIPSRSHNDSTRPWVQVLEPLSSFETPYDDVGRIVLSDVSRVDSTYYFTTSNLNQSNLENANHLFQLKNDKLTEVPYFSDYLKWSTGNSDWISINGFLIDSSGNFLFLVHEDATDKEMIFFKTDAGFNKLLSQKIPLYDYAELNQMLALSNGNMAVLMVSNKGTWSYFLYNSNMKLIGEINSAIPKEYYPGKLKENANGHIECIFYVDRVNRRDCVLQNINLN